MSKTRLINEAARISLVKIGANICEYKKPNNKTGKKTDTNRFLII
jgi:hypothetical protein